MFGSVKAGNLLPLSDINHYIPPLLHIVMGLGNNLFNELKKQIIKLDEDENEQSDGEKKARAEEIKDLYVEKDELEDKRCK